VIVTITVAVRKVNGVYHSQAVVPLCRCSIYVPAEGRSDCKAAEAAARAAMAVILAELSLGRLAWVEYETITFRRPEIGGRG
jgi:hypothetical protein